MSERLSPDRQAFKHFLPALLQQIGRRGLRDSADGRIDPQWLPELIQIRQQVKSGGLNLDAVLNRLAKLSQRIVGAGGAGVWLFTNDEIFYSAGAGNASNDERLRLDVISKLATSHQLRKETLPRRDKPPAVGTDYDTNDGPGAMSLLVEPICQGPNVAGALAVFSDELNAFTERDAANIHVLADVLAQALSKAAEAGMQESVALEPAAMLQLIDRMIPGLQRMLENDGNGRQSKRRSLPSEAEQELRAAGVGTELVQESPEQRAIEVTDGTRTAHGLESRDPTSYSVTSPALEETNVPGIGVPAAVESEAVKTPALWAVLREKYERKVALVKNYISRTRSVLRLAGGWLFHRVETTGYQVWHAARSRNNPLQLPVKAATRSVQRMKASISNAAKSAGKRMRFAAAYRSSFSPAQSKGSLPDLADVAEPRSLSHAGHPFLGAFRSTNTRLQLRLQSWPSLNVLRRTAPILGILVVTSASLILRTHFHNPAQTAASRSRTTPHENTIPLSEGTPEYRETVRTDSVAQARTREAHVAEPSGAPASLQVSHLQVTDRRTKDALRALSSYELAGLRRRAEFGDDSAAFQMGMAYEVGRGLPQSCTNAARWVARAAGQGNAAAQYNLSLRYRDGDGVPMNEDEAERWLRRAVALRHPGSKLTLTAH